MTHLTKTEIRIKKIAECIRKFKRELYGKRYQDDFPDILATAIENLLDKNKMSKRRIREIVYKYTGNSLTSRAIAKALHSKL